MFLDESSYNTHIAMCTLKVFSFPPSVYIGLKVISIQAQIHCKRWKTPLHIQLYSNCTEIYYFYWDRVKIKMKHHKLLPEIPKLNQHSVSSTKTERKICLEMKL